MKAKLQNLYGEIYDFTDSIGDEALEVLDGALASAGLTEVFERWLDGENLEQAGDAITESEAEALCDLFEGVIDELDFEYGDGEWDEEE